LDLTTPCNSLALSANLYILNCDGMDFQYVVALEKQTGKVVWKTPRTAKYPPDHHDYRKAYSTPQIISVQSKDQLISIGAYQVAAYEPLTGREMWSCDIDGFSNIPKPLYGNGYIYACTGFTTPKLVAIKADGQGDVTATNVVWSVRRNVPTKPSLLLNGELLYMLHDSGTFTCLDAKTGEEKWAQKLGNNGGGYSASPLLADGRIYTFSEKGLSMVIQPGTSFQPLATNRLENGFISTPAVSGHSIIARTKTDLYRIEKR